jgi:hypothetical protein
VFDIWMKNISRNFDLVRNNEGPSLVIAVSGSEIDRKFWEHRFSLTCKDIFRNDAKVGIVSTLESTRKGSFLGVFNAWKEAQRRPGNDQIVVPDLTLMSLVFGKGTRFSPFTQAEGNRKSAFWTPMKMNNADAYASTADISNLSVNIWVKLLREGGFKGLIVKWGDELIVPGMEWPKMDCRNIDAFRCVGKIEVTESLAREKEWVVVDKNTGLMHFQFTRQNLNALKHRLAGLAHESYELRINLGSLVLSYGMLEAGIEIFGPDIIDNSRWADWDPYVWVALCCESEEQWRFEADYEAKIGRHGIKDLEAVFPDFYRKIKLWRTQVEAMNGRKLAIGTFEFGDSFWLDLGLHLPLRQSMDFLSEDSERGNTIRQLFGIPQDRDKNGNIFVRSSVPSSADIRNSVIIDSMIRDGSSVVHNGQVIKSRHGNLMMPHGGSSLFSSVDEMDNSGPYAIAYKSISRKIALAAGDRHTTLLTPDGPVSMTTNESITDYSGDNYLRPIRGNPLSFEQAGKIMGRMDGRDIDKRWEELWKKTIDGTIA